MSAAATADPQAAPMGPSSLLPALRGDIVVTRHKYRNRVSYVVKDPVALQYFRLGELEYFIARQLNGTRTGAEILDNTQRKFPEVDLDLSLVSVIVQTLMRMGLLHLPAKTACAIHRTLKEKHRKTRFLRILTQLSQSFVSFKITLYDPDVLLRKLDRRLGFLWTPWALVALVGMLAVTVWMFAGETHRAFGHVTEMFNLQGLVTIWFVMIFVKVVHEFGHGLACKHFGGEVHEMGAMFILFSPFLFCNASDSWMFNSKWKRLVVTLGGMYLEMFLACAAAWIWFFTREGLVNHIAFTVMLICSVLTVLFNANPLMKFDGYYALADWIEVPNLKERGDRLLIGTLGRIFLGPVGYREDAAIESIKGRIILYAVASYVWTVTVAYHLLQGLGYMLEPYGLHRIAQVMSSGMLALGVVLPFVRLAFHVRTVMKKNNSTQLRQRVWLGIGAVAVVGAILIFLPLPQKVRSSCVLEGPEEGRVTAQTDGFFVGNQASVGDWVEQNDVLGKQRNPQLIAALKSAELNRQALQIEEAATVYGQIHSRVAQVKAEARQWDYKIDYLKGQRDSLTFRAPIAGLLIKAPGRYLVGTVIARGSMVYQILPAGRIRAVVALREEQAGLVQVGQEAVFRLLAMPGQAHRGRVRKVNSSTANALRSEAMGTPAGGEIPMASSPAGPKPVDPVVHVELEFTDKSGNLRPGMSGIAVIRCPSAPAGKIFYRWITEKIRRDFRM